MSDKLISRDAGANHIASPFTTPPASRLFSPAGVSSQVAHSSGPGGGILCPMCGGPWDGKGAWCYTCREYEFAKRDAREPDDDPIHERMPTAKGETSDSLRAHTVWI